jgi:hypothetical protein
MKTIEFATTNHASKSKLTQPFQPYRSATRGSFHDNLIKEEFSDLRLRFQPGTTQIRILPPLAESSFGWMLGLHVQEFKGGRFLHPKTLTKNATSAFDTAYGWMLKNRPTELFSKTNREGARLLTDPFLLCWVLVKEQDKFVPRLLLASGYDGRRGGSPGFGHQLLKLAQQVNDEGTLVKDAVDPMLGYLIEVRKTQAAGTRYASYSLTLGEAAPVSDLLQQMDAAELAAICPLEEVVQITSPEDQWKHLAATLGEDTVAAIRGSEASR